VNYADLAANAGSYYPHHFPAAATYAVVAVLGFLAVLSLLRKIIILSLLVGLVAAGVALYHHGVIDQWFSIGKAKLHSVQS
jgi:hypothetical protein